jgi:predicted transcriptional regulator
MGSRLVPSMKTSVTASSLAAYDAIVGVITQEKEREIVEVMKSGRAFTRREVSNITGMETSSVSARVNHLIFIGVIEVSGHIRCPITKKLVEAIRLAPKQQGLFE